MRLTVFIEDQTRAIDVPDHMVTEAEDVFARMDRDMDGGWQMSREWVADPDTMQRCQIAADQLLTALENGNEAMQAMMAAYILTRAPGVTGIRVDTTGEMQATELLRD